jgi:hypothetical protein
MRVFVVAAAFAALITSVAWNDPGFWVIRDTRQPKCTIVTQNPVIDGTILWGSGPYKSEDDAKLAMKTINGCN